MAQPLTREEFEAGLREFRVAFDEQKKKVDDIRQERGELEEGVTAQLTAFKDGLSKETIDKVNEVAEAVSQKFTEDFEEKQEKAERDKSVELAKEQSGAIRKINRAIGLKAAVFQSDPHTDTTSDAALEVAGYSDTEVKAIKMLREKQDNCRLYATMLNAQYRADGREPLPYAEAMKRCPDYKEALAITKVMDTADTANWLGVAYSSSLIEDLQSSHDLVARITRIPVTGNSLVLPGSNRLTGYKVPEATTEAAFASTTSRVVAPAYTDRKVTLLPVKVGGSSMMSKELEEDSLFAMVPFVRAGIINQIRRAEEYAFIDGGTSTTIVNDAALTHTDPTGVQDSASKLWNGVRAHAIQNTGTPGKNQIATTFSFEDMTSGWGKMGLYGQPQSALGIIVHPKIYAAELVPMTDSNNTPIFYGNATYQNAGATGMVPNILGVRIHQSEHVRTDLASTGVNISTTNTGSIIQIVYFPAYIYGIRREVMINPIFEPRTDQIALYGTKRCDIKPLFAPTTNAFSITICGADITG